MEERGAHLNGPATSKRRRTPWIVLGAISWFFLGASVRAGPTLIFRTSRARELHSSLNTRVVAKDGSPLASFESSDGS